MNHSLQYIYFVLICCILLRLLKTIQKKMFNIYSFMITLNLRAKIQFMYPHIILHAYMYICKHYICIHAYVYTYKIKTLE